MKLPLRVSSRPPGALLVEGILAIAVLAVAIPLVFAAVAQSGKGLEATKAETRSAWIVTACMEEIQASRENRPQYFTATIPGQEIPESGTQWALGFGAEGQPIGRVLFDDYLGGAATLNTQTLRYIATLSAVPTTPNEIPPMMQVKIQIEFPASAPAEKRKKLQYFTRIP